jgi:hypothetical protein
MERRASSSIGRELTEALVRGSGSYQKELVKPEVVTALREKSRRRHPATGVPIRRHFGSRHQINTFRSCSMGNIGRHAKITLLSEGHQGKILPCEVNAFLMTAG